MNKNPVVLIDGSPLLYIHGGRSDYKRSIRQHLESILSNNNTTQFIGFLDGVSNFRTSVASSKEYKGNRKDKKNILDRFPFFYRVKEMLIKEYSFIIVNGIEADDALGIVNSQMNPSPYAYIKLPSRGKAVKVSKSKYNTVIASIDKDLLTLNSAHYDIKTHKKLTVTDESSFIKLSDNRKKIIGAGFKFKFAQCLMGDTADNIPGLPGCGPVSAYKILNKCVTKSDYFKATKDAFVNKLGKEGEQQFINNLKLVTMLTECPSFPKLIPVDLENESISSNPPEINIKNEDFSVPF